MTPHRTGPWTLLALAVLAACSTLPPDNVQLDAARQDYRQAESDPTTRDRAPMELRAASDALRRADDAWNQNSVATDVSHWAYLARQQTAIARETGLRRADEQAASDALVSRDQIRLAARTQEADSAQRSAQMAERETQAAAAQTAAARQQTFAAQRLSADTQSRNDTLESLLRDLNARQSERGVVVTIGDVLFETDTALLRSDGRRSVDKVADFLGRYPQRSALIEGFTDSTGTPSYNQALSSRRADAVRDAIVDKGIDRSRLSTQAFGEAHPVAGNDTSSGRQMNRRVEIVLSNAAGRVTPR
jgi:outer membrane protein OmpA-like peptidoglycan-associated protein